MREHYKSRPGFTLLEVVTALAIMALVAVSALAAVGQQLNVAAHARDVARAEGLAAERLTLLRLLTSNEVQSLPDTVASGRFAYPNNAFSWHVASTPVLGETALNDVRIDVNWESGAYTLHTRLYAPPFADPKT
jgi:type II secretion system protein I